jgi:hypothetical protein
MLMMKPIRRFVRDVQNGNVGQIRLRAFRDQGQWFFEPSQKQMQMQNKWEKVHYTEADFARDRQEEIEVQNGPSSPHRDNRRARIHG